MGIEPFVIHDKDQGTKGAEIFNEPIRVELGNDKRLWLLENCVEDVLGYIAPTSDKPYKAYKFVNDNWNDNWLSISKKWRETIEIVWGIKDFYYDNYSIPEDLVAATKKTKAN